METWPALFPSPTSAFNPTVAANTVRTTMDSGLVRQRRRFSAELVTVQLTWELDDFQMGIFSAFHLYRLNLGADYFNIQLPFGGNGLQNHVARFQEGKFSQQYEDVGFWTITAVLEIQKRVLFTEEFLDTYLGLGGDDGGGDVDLTAYLDAINAWHIFLHTTYPTLNPE